MQQGRKKRKQKPRHLLTHSRVSPFFCFYILISIAHQGRNSRTSKDTPPPWLITPIWTRTLNRPRHTRFLARLIPGFVDYIFYRPTVELNTDAHVAVPSPPVLSVRPSPLVDQKLLLESRATKFPFNVVISYIENHHGPSLHDRQSPHDAGH